VQITTPDSQVEPQGRMLPVLGELSNPSSIRHIDPLSLLPTVEKKKILVRDAFWSSVTPRFSVTPTSWDVTSQAPWDVVSQPPGVCPLLQF